MKKILQKFLDWLCIIGWFASISVCQASSPTCILMRFTDDTRYHKIEAPATLSDLVLEKLINTNRFQLKETFPVDERLEEQLYSIKTQELNLVEEAFRTKNFDLAFEQTGFEENVGQTIATTSVGQFIEPSLIRKIAVAHKADYLIQGTIINLGTGDWWDEDAAKIARLVDTTSGLLGLTSIGQSMQYLQGISVQRTGVGVQCDLRVIDGSNGQVVWHKRVTSINDQKQYGIALITVGSNKLTSSLYDKAMEKAAHNIVEALVQDLNNGNLIMRNRN